MVTEAEGRTGTPLSWMCRIPRRPSEAGEGSHADPIPEDMMAREAPRRWTLVFGRLSFK